MRVLIGGASGLIGGALTKALSGRDDQVARLLRKQPPANSSDIFWDPYQEQLDSSKLNGFDAVVHLSGRNIASAPWTKSFKQSLYDSRIKSTTLLSKTLAKVDSPPSVMVVASAVGYYGDCGSDEVDESAPAGRGFMAELCRDWEAATAPAFESGIRVVNLRIGVVLSRQGGLLQKLLPTYRLGLGATLGNGNQYMSWISLTDLMRVILYVLDNQSITGPVNVVAPEPVTNRQFTRTLADAVHRPSFLKVPAFVLKSLPGDMGHETFLTSIRATPKKLLDRGFNFTHTGIKDSLDKILREN